MELCDCGGLRGQGRAKDASLLLSGMDLAAPVCHASSMVRFVLFARHNLVASVRLHVVIAARFHPTSYAVKSSPKANQW